MSKIRPIAIGMAGALVMAGSIAAFGVHAPASSPREIHPIWLERKWPFLLDQWGVGKAYVCMPADCGLQINLYLRPKIGFCNCAKGVDDDAELERVGDNELMSAASRAMGVGHAIKIGWMKGRDRLYQQSGHTESYLLSIAFNDHCDAIAALAAFDHGDQEIVEPAVVAFLNSDQILRWAGKALGL
jgi:hypothetical protein